MHTSFILGELQGGTQEDFTSFQQVPSPSLLNFQSLKCKPISTFTPRFLSLFGNRTHRIYIHKHWRCSCGPTTVIISGCQGAVDVDDSSELGCTVGTHALSRSLFMCCFALSSRAAPQESTPLTNFLFSCLHLHIFSYHLPSHCFNIGVATSANQCFWMARTEKGILPCKGKCRNGKMNGSSTSEALCLVQICGAAQGLLLRWLIRDQVALTPLKAETLSFNCASGYELVFIKLSSVLEMETICVMMRAGWSLWGILAEIFQLSLSLCDSTEALNQNRTATLKLNVKKDKTYQLKQIILQHEPSYKVPNSAGWPRSKPPEVTGASRLRSRNILLLFHPMPSSMKGIASSTCEPLRVYNSKAK